jgi:hypothetical protein
VTLDDIADELHGLPLDAFTTTRDVPGRRRGAGVPRRARAAPRAAGGPAGGADRAVRPPAPDPVRAAHQVVYALTQEARRLAAERGQAVSEDVERELQETLEAALADPAAAGAVASGRLTRALSYAGLGTVDVAGATAIAGRLPRPRRPAGCAGPGAAGEGAEAREDQEARRLEAEEERAGSGVTPSATSPEPGRHWRRRSSGWAPTMPTGSGPSRARPAGVPRRGPGRAAPTGRAGAGGRRPARAAGAATA